jgi:monoamine oxidase
MQRRKFIRQASLSAAALAILPQTAFFCKPRVRSEEPRRVLIIGAGLAGLVTAYELMKKGFDVTVLEAKDICGGRVLTLRDHFSEGLYAELGATFIPDVHELTLKYARQFNLELVPAPSTLPSVYHIRGKRIVNTDKAEWPLSLKPDEIGLGPDGLWMKYANPLVNKLGDPSKSWNVSDHKEFDNISLEDLLIKQGASRDAVTLMSLGYEEQNGGALQALRNAALHKNQKTEYCIKGGNDQLPKAFAKELGERIRYNSPVNKIEHLENKFRVSYLNNGGTETIEADKIVSAIPFSVLRTIEIIAALSPGKRHAINNMRYLPVSRIFLQSKKRYWVEQGLSGVAATDLPVMKLRHATLIQDGSSGILNTYTEGREALRVQSMNEEERIRFTTDQINQIYPGMKENFEMGYSKCWSEDEWIRGAYGIYGLGEMNSITPHISNPESDIHFAGEHTSVWSGWMQGALESGERVVNEIISW